MHGLRAGQAGAACAILCSELFVAPRADTILDSAVLARSRQVILSLVSHKALRSGRTEQPQGPTNLSLDSVFHADWRTLEHRVILASTRACRRPGPLRLVRPTSHRDFARAGFFQPCEWARPRRPSTPSPDSGRGASMRSAKPSAGTRLRNLLRRSPPAPCARWTGLTLRRPSRSSASSRRPAAAAQDRLRRHERRPGLTRVTSTSSTGRASSAT